MCKNILFSNFCFYRTIENSKSATNENNAAIKKPANQCHICDKTFANPENVKLHIKVDHEQKEAFKCSMCSHTFKSQNQLQMHISSAHPSQSKSLTCLVALCGKTYAQISHLNLHMKMDHKLSDLEIQEGLIFKCEYCGKSYTQNQNLKKHMKNVHQGQIVQEGEIFSCDQCEKVFGDEKALIIHGAKSHKVYFNCSMCSQNFIFENQLQMHISSSHPFTPVSKKSLQKVKYIGQ